jgi:hypothetical protein
MAVRSSSVGLPVMGVKAMAASAKRAVMASGDMMQVIVVVSSPVESDCRRFAEWRAWAGSEC